MDRSGLAENRARPVLAWAVLILALATGGCEREEHHAPAETTKRWLPEGSSVLLVTLDTTRRDFVSPYGADAAITPNLTELARDGTLFLNAYSQTNVTNPSHVSIMTGLRAIDHGVFNNQTRLPKRIDTLPEAFHRAGYETAAFPSSRHVGQDLGWEGWDRLEPAEPELNARQVTERFLRWIGGRRQDRPFFVWLHYWDPHAPYTPPEAQQKRFYRGDPYGGAHRLADHPYFRLAASGKALAAWIGDRTDPEYPRAMYAGEVSFVDEQLGLVLASLRRHGVDQRTAVVVIADHGESILEHDIFFAHAGLYETQLRIPFLARIPGFPRGLRPDALVTQVDVAPTLMELFGIELKQPPKGRSLLPLLRGEPAEDLAAREALVHESAHNRQLASRKGKWKLVWPVLKQQRFLPEKPQLFDLAADPGELQDLAAARPDVVQELLKPLRPWLTRRHLGARKGKLGKDAMDRLKALGYVD
ncbi:MAG: hypothetical protein QOD06_3235 [Candidatus Binatota bacterium]|nr:hypothetical protein [Candidatus Binatota bacterium]